MHRRDVEALDPCKAHWAVAVEAPDRDWVAAPGCRSHARFLVDGETKAPSRESFALFESRAQCLAWIMANRRELSEHMPGATIHPVSLASWLLGLA
ncbi:hypothetical protein [Sphingomonas quercus]|uniref:Uncharacterized protein n=1 Tax=Sphingomonas quercus TaxID=2842451 RepID=A0ABS6BF15_9SPHN|nr:hypothetical protein [Sphingomonas quercus]MBU3076759.1 hypothetical protein [Sphingomonas quercus]